jgi:hypothetical protein
MKITLRKSLASAGITASLLMGAAGIASAQDSPSTTVPASTVAPQADVEGRDAHMQEVLAPLVSTGTLTQAQSDAVVKAFREKAPEGRGNRGGRGGPGRGQGRHSATIAKALGVTEAELLASHQAGKTIAQLAAEKSVDLNIVINALVAEEKAEHPDRTEAEIRQHVTDMVNGVRPTKPKPSTTK